MIFRLDETDLVLLYSAKPLRHKQYPSPAKFSTALPEDYSQSQISLIAYNKNSLFSTYKDYSDISCQTFQVIFDKLLSNYLFFIIVMTKLRYTKELIYHRYSSLIDISKDSLINENEELMS